MGDGEWNAPRVYIGAGTGWQDIKVHAGSIVAVPGDSENFAEFIEALADCTPGQIRRLADEIRVAASVIEGAQ